MKSDSRRKKKRVLNVVELGEGELVYVRLDDGKKYLLNGSGCWRCGSTADCFGNMIDDDKLDIICEFDFFDEVRSLFLCLLQNRLVKLASWLREKMNDKSQCLLESLSDVISTIVNCVNVKKDVCKETTNCSGADRKQQSLTDMRLLVNLRRFLKQQSHT